MSKVEVTEMPLLEKRLTESHEQLCFLMDFVTLSPLDLEFNTETIQWFRRMPSIFMEHQRIITEKTEQYQNGLQVCVSALLYQFIDLLNVGISMLICIRTVELNS